MRRSPQAARDLDRYFPITESDEELEQRCRAAAEQRDADFVLRPTAGGGGGYEAKFVSPMGVDPDSLNALIVEGYRDNTAWGAMRRLLDVPGARAEGRR